MFCSHQFHDCTVPPFHCSVLTGIRAIPTPLGGLHGIHCSSRPCSRMPVACQWTAQGRPRQSAVWGFPAVLVPRTPLGSSPAAQFPFLSLNPTSQERGTLSSLSLSTQQDNTHKPCVYVCQQPSSTTISPSTEEAVIDGDWLELRRFGSTSPIDPKGLEPNYISNNNHQQHDSTTTTTIHQLISAKPTTVVPTHPKQTDPMIKNNAIVMSSATQGGPVVPKEEKKGFGKVLARVKTVLRTKRLSTSGAKADPAATADKKGKETAKR